MRAVVSGIFKKDVRYNRKQGPQGPQKLSKIP